MQKLSRMMLWLWHFPDILCSPNGMCQECSYHLTLPTTNHIPSVLSNQNVCIHSLHCILLCFNFTVDHLCFNLIPTVWTVLWFPNIKHPQSWRMTAETLQTSERTWHNEELHNMNTCINRCFMPHYYGNVKKIHTLFCVYSSSTRMLWNSCGIPRIPQQVGIYYIKGKKVDKC